ncbi:hypothetical protein H310_11644 [Aphanomyces invadans]|uniref:SAM domain-containing protein n=1 Tax=Aphanomyces invadans TaxID=157072 RepID=A0A024TLZ8_9STRA|nr:hypothetical protein H310_11644 [Aphanomyces invadans]ETV94656.1 hypothetical protein H310_11644 [Aphanomyces invadans]|eukprot:XP_008876601.1 hypothetical protein H310_11644 [Aphanomyces invadans]
MDWQANLDAIIKCTDENLRHQFETYKFPSPTPFLRPPNQYNSVSFHPASPTMQYQPPPPTPLQPPASQSKPSFVPPPPPQDNNASPSDYASSFHHQQTYNLAHMMEQVRYSIKLEVDARAAVAERQLSAIMALTKSNSDELDRLRLEANTTDREVRGLDQTQQKLRQDMTTQKDIMYHVQSMAGKDESWRLQADNQLLELRQMIAALREQLNSLQVTMQEKLSRPELLVHFNACVEPLKAQLNAGIQHQAQVIGELSRNGATHNYVVESMEKRIRDMDTQMQTMKHDVEAIGKRHFPDLPQARCDLQPPPPEGVSVVQVHAIVEELCRDKIDVLDTKWTAAYESHRCKVQSALDEVEVRWEQLRHDLASKATTDLAQEISKLDCRVHEGHDATKALIAQAALSSTQTIRDEVDKEKCDRKRQIETLTDQLMQLKYATQESMHKGLHDVRSEIKAIMAAHDKDVQGVCLSIVTKDVPSIVRKECADWQEKVAVVQNDMAKIRHDLMQVRLDVDKCASATATCQSDLVSSRKDMMEHQLALGSMATDVASFKSVTDNAMRDVRGQLESTKGQFDVVHKDRVETERTLQRRLEQDITTGVRKSVEALEQELRRLNTRLDDAMKAEHTAPVGAAPLMPPPPGCGFWPPHMFMMAPPHPNSIADGSKVGGGPMGHGYYQPYQSLFHLHPSGQFGTNDQNQSPVLTHAAAPARVSVPQAPPISTSAAKQSSDPTASPATDSIAQLSPLPGHVTPPQIAPSTTPSTISSKISTPPEPAQHAPAPTPSAKNSPSVSVKTIPESECAPAPFQTEKPTTTSAPPIVVGIAATSCPVASPALPMQSPAPIHASVITGASVTSPAAARTALVQFSQPRMDSPPSVPPLSHTQEIPTEHPSATASVSPEPVPKSIPTQQIEKEPAAGTSPPQGISSSNTNNPPSSIPSSPPVTQQPLVPEKPTSSLNKPPPPTSPPPLQASSATSANVAPPRVTSTSVQPPLQIPPPSPNPVQPPIAATSQPTSSPSSALHRQASSPSLSTPPHNAKDSTKAPTILDDPSMKGALAEAELAKARVESRLRIERERRHTLGGMSSPTAAADASARSMVNALSGVERCSQCNQEISKVLKHEHDQQQCPMRMQTCPTCQQSLRAKDIPGHLCDKPLAKCRHCLADVVDVADHETKCEHALKQCPHCLRRQKMADLQDHINNCDCRLVQCPNACGGKFLQRGLEKHVLTKCPKRPQPTTTSPKAAPPPPSSHNNSLKPKEEPKPLVQAKVECKYCDEEYTADGIDAHEQSCDWKPKRCQFCNMVIISRDLARHESNCKQSNRQCAHCHQSFTSPAYASHVPKCLKRPIKCIRCGDLFAADIIVAHSTSCKPGEAKSTIPPPPSTPPPIQIPQQGSPSKRRSESDLRKLVTKPDHEGGPSDRSSRRNFALSQLTAPHEQSVTGRATIGRNGHRDVDAEEEEEDGEHDLDDVTLAQVVAEWNVEHVCLWLREDVVVPDVVDRFEALQIDGQMLLELDEQALVNDLGIKAKASRDRILAAIDAIKTSEDDEDEEDESDEVVAPPSSTTRHGSALARRLSTGSSPQTQANLLSRINSALYPAPTCRK